MIPELTFSTGLDLLISILLIATIAYAVTLNRKLNLLRQEKTDMETAIARLIEATGKAQTGLDGLRTHADEAGERLEQGLERARGRADELVFLIEQAEAMSCRLDSKIAGAKTSQKQPAAGVNLDAVGPGQQPEDLGLSKSLRGLR